jgi:glycosyltransferase involved in cell wall biosynthesis
MKVAHINCLLGKGRVLGVEKKLGEQAKAVAELGLDMDILYFNFTRQLYNEGVLFYRRGEGSCRELFSMLSRYACVSEYIDVDKYDLMVLRYSGADFSIFRDFLWKNAARIITEHHTKELPEALTYNTTLPQKLITLFMERLLGPIIIRKCAGLIANCEEVKAYELRRAGCAIPSTVVTDGVFVEDVPFSGHAPYTGNELSLLCIAAFFDPWQGLDRVLRGLQDYTSQSPLLHLKVVGNVSAEDYRSARPLVDKKNVKVEFLGKLYGPRLEEVFGNTHLAFSPLAMFRKKINEGCALKTREYLARGLPFIIGHADPDLDDVQNYFLSILPDNSPVDMNRVVEFAEQVLKARGVSRAMREFAETRVDWKIKMLEMWDFLKSVSKGENSANR